MKRHPFRVAPNWVTLHLLSTDQVNDLCYSTQRSGCGVGEPEVLGGAAGAVVVAGHHRVAVVRVVGAALVRHRCRCRRFHQVFRSHDATSSSDGPVGTPKVGPCFSESSKDSCSSRSRHNPTFITRPNLLSNTLSAEKTSWISQKTMTYLAVIGGEGNEG